MGVSKLQFLRDLEEFAKSLPEEKRSRLYRIALEFYVFGAENTHYISNGVNPGNVGISRRINLEILKRLEKRCKEDKPYIPQFVYNL